MQRCAWAKGDLMVDYHDREWGRETHGDASHLELLVLEGAQAGLSWLTILRRREGYRRAFGGFDPEHVAALGPVDVERIMEEGLVIRHRGKIESAIANARGVLELAAAAGSFDAWVWERFGPPRINRPVSTAEVPSTSAESVALSKELKSAGFRFVGPTTCYSYLQSAGMVVDHLVSCYCHPDNIAS